jgi:hypothetical protein
VNGEVHGGRPRPTGAVVPRGKKNRFSSLCSLINVVTAATDQTFEVLNFVLELKDDLPFTFCKEENNMIRRKYKIRFIRFGPKEEVHIWQNNGVAMWVM